MTDYLANKGKPWSPEDLASLEKIYPDTDNKTLARIFRRSKFSIKNQASLYGWKKSEAHMAEKPGCFKAGSSPWNKGTNYSAPGTERTRFKKGHMPPNWKPIGTERITKDGYLQRKLTDTGNPSRDWVAVSHIEWEKHNGRPVPKGHAVVFRDEDNRNFAGENLELISRADLMRRNSYLHLPPEIAQIVQLRGALTAKINRRSKQA
ncbi:HNH endonuclease signature motif containing protein [Vreelandella sedimenti]|uniref:HNH endonuclease signature motif containing protein n=1 Tax=Vreelandella sedimenti TaxID=2729618 RepID=UPI00257FD758|nr:HNH endonuclease signature motif containing protein [Halomonas sp. UBA3173]|tara:strand:- start:39075 stop:39692 length:618 start_codon:yes stop_codon:yes gene_type:complete